MSENDKPSMPPSKQEVMRSIGQTLAERRKARGLTIEKIMQILKIRIPYLKAIEAGDWGELPGEVYARGFTKRYAVYLGLDAEKLMAPYLNEKSPDIHQQGPDNTNGGSDASKGIMIAVAVVAVFLIVLVKLAKNENKPATAAEPTKVEAPAAPPVAVAKSSAPAVAADLPAAADAHKMEVYSPYPLWVHVSAEDKTFEGFIPQGATWTWSAKGKFAVRLGHSRKVSMLFDGVPVPITENQKKLDLPE